MACGMTMCSKTRTSWYTTTHDITGYAKKLPGILKILPDMGIEPMSAFVCVLLADYAKPFLCSVWQITKSRRRIYSPLMVLLICLVTTSLANGEKLRSTYPRPKPSDGPIQPFLVVQAAIYWRKLRIFEETTIVHASGPDFVEILNLLRTEWWWTGLTKLWNNSELAIEFWNWLRF